MEKNKKGCMIFFIMVIGISLIHEFVKDVIGHGILLGIIGFIPTIIMPIMAIGLYQLLKKDKKEHVYSEEEKCIRAYHEAGHAVIATVLKSADIIKKLSILPEDNNRPISTMFEIGELSAETTKSEAEEMLLITLGGRAAEQLAVNNTFYASIYDFEEATNLLTEIIKTVYKTDGEICSQEILESLEDKAINILMENRNLLNRITQELIEKEVIFGDDIEYIIIENIIV